MAECKVPSSKRGRQGVSLRGTLELFFESAMYRQDTSAFSEYRILREHPALSENSIAVVRVLWEHVVWVRLPVLRLRMCGADRVPCRQAGIPGIPTDSFGAGCPRFPLLIMEGSGG